jgi:hypothetical protein
VLGVHTAEDLIADGLFSRQVNETNAESQRKDTQVSVTSAR